MTEGYRENKHFLHFKEWGQGGFIPKAIPGRSLFKNMVFILIVWLCGCTDPLEEALKATDPSKGVVAVGKLTDQASLARVSQEAISATVRGAAVEKLTDQSVLNNIARNDKIGWIRCCAVARLTDQSLLARIAQEDKDKDVRSAALAKLTDPSLLSMIAQLNEDKWDRHDAVEKITDQALLAKIAQKDVNKWIRRTAVEKLSDQALLAEIAQKDMEQEVRKAAMDKLSNPNGLLKLARQANDPTIRRTAMKKLSDMATDPALLLAVLSVRNDTSEVNLPAVQLTGFDSIPKEHLPRLISEILPARFVLTDPEVADVVGDIVSISVHWSSRTRDYFRGLGDSTPIGYLSGEDFSCSIKLSEMSRNLSCSWSTSFPDQTLYTTDALSSQVVPYREIGFRSGDINTGDLLGSAFACLPQNVLARIVQENGDWQVRGAAVKLLNDETLIGYVAQEDAESKVRCAAAEMLIDLKLLSKIAQEDISGAVRHAAETRLNTLRQIMQTSERDSN